MFFLVQRVASHKIHPQKTHPNTDEGGEKQIFNTGIISNNKLKVILTPSFTLKWHWRTMKKYWWPGFSQEN